MKYRTILMDADGTLFDFLRSEREAVAEAFAEIGVDVDDEMIDTYSRINDSLWKKLELGDIEKRVLFYHRFELFFEQYGISADAKKMAQLYMHRLATKGYLLDGASELCETLYGKARLYIVTNGTEFIQKGRFAASGLSSYFDEVFISDVIGIEKPNVGFFNYVAARIPDFERETTLVVGDSLTSDIRGGINAGLDTCWFNPNGKAAPEELQGKITCVAHSFDEIYRFITEETHDFDCGF